MIFYFFSNLFKITIVVSCIITNSTNIRKLAFNIILFVSLFISHLSFAQSYNFEYYNIEEGLPQSRVNDIIQDSRGYLWIGTAGGGVCRFNGSTFVQYEEKDGISGNIVTGLTEDKEGSIWITSTWGGVTKYNGRNFFIFSKKDGLLNDNGNNVIFTTKEGTVWIGSSAGIVTYKNGTFKNYTKKNSKLIGNNINCISEDSKNNIWVGTDKGISIFSEKGIINISTENGLKSNNITAIIEDYKGDFYIGSYKGVSKLLIGSLSTIRNLEFDEEIIDGENMIVTDLLEDHEKNIWIATSSDGLYVLNKTGSYSHITKMNGLLTNSLTKLFVDKSSNLWIGTNGAGLIKYGNKAFTYFNKIPGLNNPGIFSITKDQEDNIWVATNDEGIYKYDGTTSIQFTAKNGLGSNSVRSSLLDNKGYLWFATTNGLTRYKNGTFKTFTVKDGLPSNDTRVLLLDKSDNLWIGTYGKGLSKYNYATFENFTTKDGLSQDFIHSLFEDSKGNIWIGTSGGVTKYNKSGFTNFAKAKGFCNSYIGSITEDKSGNIWFGTDRCIVKYDGIDFKPFTIEDGLSSNTIYLIHGDSKGNLWVGTNNGVDKISFDSYGQIRSIKNYKSKQGFKGVECNSRAVFEDKKNNLWFGTVKGLIKYNPTEDRTNVFEPNIHINNIKLFFKDVNWLDYSKELIKWNNLPVNLVLDHNENHLTFEFSAINLTFPEEIQYRFKLIPFDDQWYNTTDKTFATYSNLPPGEYTFNVKARNEDGIWNQAPATYSFKISAPWWKKWWAVLIITIIIFYVIYKISSFKEKRQRRISEELEFKVIERTELINSQKDEKEVLLKEIHHRVKNNMQVIISLLSIQSGYTKDEKALVLFDEAKNRIRSMALIHEKMYQSGDLAHINFQDYIMALTNDLISTYSINCDIFLDIKIEKIKFTIDALIPLGLLINEIISNALKYAFNDTNKGRIKIHLTFEEQENFYTLIVGDNGIGMPKETLDKEDETLGMELIKVFVSQLDGKIKILEEKGTFFEIKFQPKF